MTSRDEDQQMIPKFEMEKVKATYREDNLCKTASQEKIIKKGLIWVQQDKLFSRWKEMMLLVGQWSLTKDHLITILTKQIFSFSLCI